MITGALLLLLTSPLWIGWMMEYEHNKTKHALADVALQCSAGSSEKREVWSKLGVAVFCEKDGAKHGSWQAWDGGYLHISGNYADGKKHGVWKYFNAYGERWGTRVYASGKEVSELTNLLTADAVLVRKHERRLYLIKNGKAYRTYAVKLGANAAGPKQIQDDGRTPEGSYVLDAKNENSRFYKSIHVSYPNNEERKRAQEAGVLPGGAIMIHGQPDGFGWAWWILGLWDWTNGSIAVRNNDMDEIWGFVEVGTPIEIMP